MLEPHLISYKLGETTVYVEKYQNTQKGLTYFQPHSNQSPFYDAAKKAVDHYGGTLYSVQTNQNNRLEFIHAQRKYHIDPEFIFSKAGIAQNFSTLGQKINEQITDIILQFSTWLLGMLVSPHVIALCNHHPTDHTAIHSKQKNDANANTLIHTSDHITYQFAKQTEFRALLHTNQPTDNGSICMAAYKKKMPYTLIELNQSQALQANKVFDFINRVHAPQRDLGPKHSWPLLQKGDTIDLVAPSSRYPTESITTIKSTLAQLGLNARDKYAKQAHIMLPYSASDQERFEQLYSALGDPDSKAVWSIRGGSGSSRLLPKLLAAHPLPNPKPIIGFSDFTNIHILVNTLWNWPSIHGITALYNQEVNKHTGNTINQDSTLSSIVDILLGRTHTLKYTDLQALNQAANQTQTITSTLFGGNLTLISNAIGSPFIPQREKFILVLEDVGNTPQQLERFLDKYCYSHIIENCEAIILGTFIASYQDRSAQTKQQTMWVLQRFAEAIDVPVFRSDFFGHARYNQPIPLGTRACITQASAGQCVLEIQTR